MSLCRCLVVDEERFEKNTSFEYVIIPLLQAFYFLLAYGCLWDLELEGISKRGDRM